MDSVRARLETWHLVVSEGDPEPESLFEIAEDACDRVAELESQLDAHEGYNAQLEGYLWSALPWVSDHPNANCELVAAIKRVLEDG